MGSYLETLTLCQFALRCPGLMKKKGSICTLSVSQDAHGVNLDNKGLVIANTVHLPLPCFCLTFCLRLKEIDMSEYDAATYERFSSAVRRQVQSLRIILDSLQVGVTPHTVCV